MTTPGATKKGDFFFDSFFSGLIGATVVAVVLLALDFFRGEPFHTPTLLGAVLFTDTPASQVADVRLDLVTYATIAHFVAFSLLAVATSALVVNVRMLRRNPVVLIVLLLVAMEAGIRIVSLLFAPDLVAIVGAGRILTANAFSAVAMGGFLAYAHREDVAEAPAEAATV